MTIGILSIGTEITTGQILNSNAQWIAQELLHLGLTANYHMSVPDTTMEINEALAFLESRVKVILITGGLGPTADDITRNILSERYHRPLILDAENWGKIQSKLKSKGAQVRDIHRQQCEFPQGATLLTNAMGIADGFTLKVTTDSNSLEIYALPGPPKEMISIFRGHLISHLNSLLPESEKWMQSMWTIRGLPESEVATLVNGALGPESSQVLYRTHHPFIDVKLLYRRGEIELNKIYGQKIEAVLKSWLVIPNDPTSEDP